MERRGFWRESFAQSLEWFFGTMQPNIRHLMARRRSRLVSNTRNRWSMQPTIRVLALKPRRGTEVRSGIPFFWRRCAFSEQSICFEGRESHLMFDGEEEKSPCVQHNQRFESWLWNQDARVRRSGRQEGVHSLTINLFRRSWIAFERHHHHDGGGRSNECRRWWRCGREEWDWRNRILPSSSHASNLAVGWWNRGLLDAGVCTIGEMAHLGNNRWSGIPDLSQ